MERKLTRAFAVILAVFTVSATGALLASCGSNDNTAATEKATDAATVVETTETATESPTETEAHTEEDTQAQDNDSQDDNDDEADQYIDKSEALAKVKSIAGSGSTIISAEQGHDPDGLPAWIIKVSPITSSTEEKIVTYYCNDSFCYSDDE